MSRYFARSSPHSTSLSTQGCMSSLGAPPEGVAPRPTGGHTGATTTAAITSQVAAHSPPARAPPARPGSAGSARSPPSRAPPKKPVSGQLRRAARVGDTPAIQKILDGGATSSDISGSDGEGRTALHLAALAGHVDAVRALAAGGLEHKDKKGATALHSVAEAAMHDVLRLLASLGADVNATNEKGIAALLLSLSRPLPPSLPWLLNYRQWPNCRQHSASSGRQGGRT